MISAQSDVYDQLGEQLGLIYCGDDGKVQFTFETDSFKKAFEKMQDWNQKGYVYDDVSTSQPSASDYVKAGVAFSYFTPSEFGAQAAHSVNCGMDMIAVEIAASEISAAACTKFTWCVPTTAKEPEAAVAFLNYAITSPEINNLLAWGVEGVDYEVAAVTTVDNEFHKQIESGQADAATYEACIEKYYSVGMDKILEEYQRQLDEYMAAQE